MAEDAFERWSAQGKRDVDIDEATSFVKSVSEKLQGRVSGWGFSDIKEELDRVYGREIALIGGAKIVKGDKPAVALNSDQFEVIGALYGIDAALHTMLRDCQIIMSNDSGNKTETAKLVWISHPKSGEIIISQGLAQKLSVRQGDIIRILNASNDLNDLNLDEYWK